MIGDSERLADGEDLKSIMMELDIDESETIQVIAKERTWKFCTQSLKYGSYTYKELARTAFLYYQAYLDSSMRNKEFYENLGFSEAKAKEAGKLVATKLLEERQNSQNQVLAAS